ncbi:MAG: yxiO, partial [Blastococcus sp.]|nr:yxiO [Blastococcus sp.]
MTTAPPAAGAGPAVPSADRELTRERFGWYSYDWAMSVFNTSVTTVFLAPYLTSIAESAADANDRVHPLGLSVPSGSYFGYVLSLSVLLQVVILPLTGAVADRSGHKRQLLAGFA